MKGAGGTIGPPTAVDRGRKAEKRKYVYEGKKKRCSKTKLREAQSYSRQGSLVSCLFQLQERKPSLLKINPNGKSIYIYIYIYYTLLKSSVRS
jgi:hypothetical protein